ncbi:MAG: hypothetical protein ABEK12_01890 [Candidatus Nanohaloarchaea archaeon]
MRWIADAFRENTGLQHVESVKMFLFAVKTMAGAGFLGVLGYLGTGSPLDEAALLIIGLAASIDLGSVPVLLNLRPHLPPAARRLETVQLVLKAVAYLVLAATLLMSSGAVFGGYAVFATVWLASYGVEHTAFFLLRPGERHLIDKD